MAESLASSKWLEDASEFLRELIAVQQDLAAQLVIHRAERDGSQSPLAIAPDASLLERLESCHQKRSTLLKAAGEAGLRNGSLQGAIAACSREPQALQAEALLRQAASTSRRLQLASVTHWMLAQRSLTHVSQLLEILATGLPQPPTYGNGAVPTACGGLLDQAA